MNLRQFYGLLRDAVEQYPETEESYQRLQTFAVLQSISDLNADNLGHSVFSKGTNYFYSRRWEAANHAANNVVYFPPLLYALPVSNVFVDPFQVRAYQHVTIEIGALYPNLEKTENTFAATCKRVNRDNIYVLAASWMNYVFGYLTKAVFANTDVDLAYRWHNQDKLEADILSGDISTYTVNTKTTNQFRSDLKNANPRTGGNFVDNFSKNNFCGAFYTIILPVQQCRGSSGFGGSSDDGLLIDDTGMPLRAD